MQPILTEPGIKPISLIPIFAGVCVAAIWASSFVFVKMGLVYIGPLTLAGLRYSIAALALLPWMGRCRGELMHMSRGAWMRLGLLGLCAYTFGNGAFFIALQYLPATTLSFMMSFIPVLVMVAGMVWLKEYPTRSQMVGLGIALLGSGLFFANGVRTEATIGLLIVMAGLIAFAVFGILGRGIARARQMSTLLLTALPLAIGGGSLLLIALPIEGLPRMTLNAWGIALWLGVVNTALAYMIYNHALKDLTALEMNTLLNLSPLGTALLAWLLLAERLSWVQLLGIVIAVVGIALVQKAKS